jgi:tRNA-2-methylthio-N6-dimethylallyladenosine synthase
MNEHDSERAAGILEAVGYRRADDPLDADLVLLNTCAVRENADERLYGTLGHLKGVKEARRDEGRDLTIVVGGCLAQKDGATVAERAPWVDVVYGTHNLGDLPDLLARADADHLPVVELIEALEVFPSALPSRRGVRHHAWVSISVGCDNTCAFCIVPALRGPERSRTVAEVLGEVRALVADDVIEVTLLGQNVNSYGRDLGGRALFADLLRDLGDVEGLERVRFTSPHPRDFTPDVLEAMAETSNVMPHLHLPLQSGSDRILRDMRRSYRRERYLELVARTRELLPDASLTTDIIVGFPGETEADFLDTLAVVEQVCFDQAFTFQYSPRPGTDAAEMTDRFVDPDTVAHRYRRLEERVRAHSIAAHERLIGRIVELLGDRDDLTLDDLAAIQLDGHNTNAATLVPYLLALPSDDLAVTVVQQLLLGWDHQDDADSAASAAFNGTWRALLARTFHDELPEWAWPGGGGRWWEVVRGLLEDPSNAWWHDEALAARQTRDDVLLLAMADAHAELSELLGDDPEAWRWGAIHTLTLTHESFGSSGIGPVEQLFNRGPLETSGGTDIVNANSWSAADGYAVVAVPSMRMLMDLSDLDAGRWIHLTGQSGRPYHRHYTDQAERWRDGGYAAMTFSPQATAASAEHILTLQPSG